MYLELQTVVSQYLNGFMLPWVDELSLKLEGFFLKINCSLTWWPSPRLASSASCFQH